MTLPKEKSLNVVPSPKVPVQNLVPARFALSKLTRLKLPFRNETYASDDRANDTLSKSTSEISRRGPAWRGKPLFISKAGRPRRNEPKPPDGLDDCPAPGTSLTVVSTRTSIRPDRNTTSDRSIPWTRCMRAKARTSICPLSDSCSRKRAAAVSVGVDGISRLSAITRVGKTLILSRADSALERSLFSRANSSIS